MCHRLKMNFICLRLLYLHPSLGYFVNFMISYNKPRHFYDVVTSFWCKSKVTRRVPLVVQELFNLPEHMSSPPVFSGVRVTGSLVSSVKFCRSLVVLLFFLFWPLCCLIIFDLWILITPLVSSNSPCMWQRMTMARQGQNNTCMVML